MPPSSPSRGLEHKVRQQQPPSSALQGWLARMLLGSPCTNPAACNCETQPPKMPTATRLSHPAPQCLLQRRRAHPQARRVHQRVHQQRPCCTLQASVQEQHHALRLWVGHSKGGHAAKGHLRCAWSTMHASLQGLAAIAAAAAAGATAAATSTVTIATPPTLPP